jgi:hypothetical protein
MPPRRLRVAIGAAAASAGFLIAGAPWIAGSAADAARECKPPKYPGSGYFTSLSVTGVGCATGRKLALAYYRCRTEHGKTGRCRRPVMRFTCTEQRNSIPTEFDARVRCKRGGQRVIHTYQQNT